MNAEVSLNSLPKDVAKIVARHVGSFFSFSSINRHFRGFFQKEREQALKKVKIFVKENGNSSFLLTFEGKLYACGENKNDHFGLGDKKEKLPRDIKCYRQWTPIGPPGKKISEVVLEDEHSVFVRCGHEWFGAGSHPYIQHVQRDRYQSTSWVCVWGPEPFVIEELIPTTSSIFIRCKDGFCYAYNWDAGKDGGFEVLKSSKIYWKRIAPQLKKIEKFVVCEKRIFLLCAEGWYGYGENKNGEFGAGFCSDWEKGIKIGPQHKKILVLKATQFNTFVYCDDKKWYACGRNHRGQLGTGNREAQLKWIPLGPKNKSAGSLFFQNAKTFVSNAKELYMCGEKPHYNLRTRAYDDMRDDLNWISINCENHEILNVIVRGEIAFIQCADGWYGYGDGDLGQFGFGYKGRFDEEPKKLNCYNKPILKLVASKWQVFVCCEDGWYFAGFNREGQNGMNDASCTRAHWTKIISHGETIEQAVDFSFINTNNQINKDLVPLQFRHALKKLYDPYYISIFEDMFLDMNNSFIKLGYNLMYENKYQFFLFLEKWDFNNLMDSEVDEITGLLRKLMEFSSVIFLADDHFNGGGFPWHLRGNERQNYPFPTHWVNLSTKNHEEICRFLEGYEKMLDEYELAHCEENHERRSHHK